MKSLRRQLYQGAIRHIPALASSRLLVSAVRELLVKELGRAPERAQFRMDNDEFLAAIGRVRQALREPRLVEATRSIVREAGFPLKTTAIDFPRLRAVKHGGHGIPEAWPVYAVHRDTWYANPQSQINWWLAVHEVTAEESFRLFPDAFDQPVENSSQTFDYSDWVRRVGWQSARPSTGSDYPAATGSMAHLRPMPITCDRGDLILFSAAHLHQTCAHTAGRTRFSIDFRTVDLEDHRRKLGAPNVDNRSRGAALRDYLSPTKGQP